MEQPSAARGQREVSTQPRLPPGGPCGAAARRDPSRRHQAPRRRPSHAARGCPPAARVTPQEAGAAPARGSRVPQLRGPGARGRGRERRGYFPLPARGLASWQPFPPGLMSNADSRSSLPGTGSRGERPPTRLRLSLRRGGRAMAGPRAGWAGGGG